MNLKERQEKEFDLWTDWNKTHNQKKLDELVTSFHPLIQSTVSKYRAAPIPDSALEAMSKYYLVEGLKTYKPDKGTALNTHLNNYQKGMYRFVTQHQNVARIPEHRVRKVGLYINVYNSLEDRLGRIPTAMELAEELNWDIREVERMQKELVQDLVAEKTEEDFGSTGYISFDDYGKNKEILEMLYYDLTPEEKLVYEHVYGVGGKRMLDNTRDIANKLKWSEDKVRRIRRNIGKKFKEAIL